MKNKLHTPFGEIYVKLNNSIINFKCSEKNWNYKNKEVKVFLIDIDTIDMKVGDVVFCGFEDKKLEYNDGDERANLLICENDEFMLGVCGFEPQYHQGEEEWYSYYLTEYNGYGFEYLVEREPRRYTWKFYESEVITLAVCWMKENDFEEIDDDIFMVLTCEIGGLNKKN